MPTIGYEPREHGSAAPLGRWRRFLRPAILVFCALAVSLTLPAVEVGIQRGWVDAVTGSYRSETDWVFGFTSAERVVPSALEARLTQMGVVVPRDWRNVKGTLFNGLGRGIGNSHGSAPAIYPLRIGDLMKRYVDASTDAEILEFVRIMQTGTEDEQEAAVEAAADKAWATYGGSMIPASRPSP